MIITVSVDMIFELNIYEEKSTVIFTYVGEIQYVLSYRSKSNCVELIFSLSIHLNVQLYRPCSQSGGLSVKFCCQIK